MTRCLIRPVMIAVCAATLVPNGVCQQIAAKPAPEARADHQVFSRVPADRLAELSGSLQRLASKVSPAVVQIEVSRFGLSEEGERKSMPIVEPGSVEVMVGPSSADADLKLRRRITVMP